MQLDNLHKHVQLNKMANGTVEVLFAGQPAMSISELFDGFVYTLNPVFCKLTYGANVFSDVPYCNEINDSVEEAVASGFAKLEAIGAFKSMSDLPEDTYATKLADDWDVSIAAATKDIKTFAAQHSDDLMEATRYASYLLGAKIKPIHEAEEVVAAFKSGSITKAQTKSLYEHALLHTPAIYSEDGLPVFSRLVAEEKKLENSHIETTLAQNDINSKVSDGTVQVHKDNVQKARTIIKRLGQKHKVVSGLNEGAQEQARTGLEQTIVEKTGASTGTSFKAFKKRLNESLRLVSTHKNDANGLTAKVYKDNDWDEHRVKFFKDGVHQTEADYHTDDKDDAKHMASKWAEGELTKHIKEDRQRSEFSANSFLANAKKGTPADMNNPLERKDKKVRIISPTGGTISKHDDRSSALMAYKKMGSPKNCSIKEGEESEETDITAIMEAASDDYDKAEQKWRDDVTAKHGAKGVKFFGRIEKGVHTISAEIPGKDKSVGVWNPEKAVGHVFEQEEDVIGELVVERELSPDEENKREEIIMALKKNKNFIRRYGKDAIWAVATAQAKHAE